MKVDDTEFAAAVAAFDDDLAGIGLHSVNVSFLDGEQQAALISCLVGALAFTPRVQNPAQHATDRDFRELATHIDRSGFDDTRAELERRIREGLPLFGDDE